MQAARDGDETAIAALLQRLAQAPQSRYGAGRAALDDYAPLSGAALADEVEAHPPFGRLQLAPEPLIRAGLTAVAVPRPTPIAWSRADLDAEAQVGTRMLRRAGLAARGRTSDCLEGGLVVPGTLAISDALDALDALSLPVGPITAAAALQRAAEVWEIVGPEVIIADAASSAFLYAAGGYPRPRAFIELLTPGDAAALQAPARAEVFRIFSLPQVHTFVAGECRAHDGLHLADDAVYAEVVDGGSRLPDGTPGRLLLTTLTRSLTLVRFDSGIGATLDRSPCACGDTAPRLRFV